VTTIIGIDLSTTRTGVCVNGETFGIEPPKKATLLGKAMHVRDALRDWVMPADLIIIEDYATTYAKVAFSMGYLHCMIDELLIGLPVHKIPPASLKKWAVNHGNANKDMMLSAAIRAGSPADNNDEADAWWLHAMGAHIAGEPCLPGSLRNRIAVLDKLGITPGVKA
jgi:Holliday junction resolvasome RuvABC endonuclease subunit